MASRRNRMVIDLTDGAEHEYDEEFRQILDLTREDENHSFTLQSQHGEQSRGRGRGRSKTPRNVPLDRNYRSVATYRVRQGLQLRVHDFVELAQPVGFWRANFFEVKQIWITASGDEVLLRGLPYARNSEMDGRFELRTNEVCQILEIDDDDKRTDEQQAMIEVRPCGIVTVRNFHKTNADFHSARNCRYGNNPYWTSLGNSSEAKRERRERAPLTCRWRVRFQYHNAGFRRAAKAFGTTAIHLTERDVDDPHYQVPDEQRRKEWLKRHPVSAGQSSAQRLPEYTYFDAFCGGGGATSGARQGGLKPMMAIDFWEAACDSYKRNFPNTRLFRQDVHDFITRTDFDDLPYIDVLHISPPCQYYSPAKVSEGKDDEKNEVALWACGELVERIRPRIFTMEQTYGLLAERFTQHFNKLIQCFTKHGYSIDWRERVELNQYGLPQNRKRLIIIGAAPGEKLPPWPAPTHGVGRKPWVTEAMAIGRFPRNITLHDVHNARRIFGAAPRNPNTPLSRTIVCSGAQGMFHYSGQRDYTLRELATLQGFPLDHQFVGPSHTAIKKQIGNAFPASVSKVFFQSIRESLEREDRKRMFAPRSPSAFGRTRAFQSPHLPGYSRLNGDLGEDEALQIAMDESRNTRRERRRRTYEVITIDDSDEDMLDLPDSITHLSVESSQPSPPTTGGSSNSHRTTHSWASMSTPNEASLDRQHGTPSSAASSVTLNNSPSPSPCQQQTRKRKSDDQTESARKRARDTVVNDMTMSAEAYHAKKIADRATARAAARDEASLPPREGDGRLLTFGTRNWLGKLPVTRDSGYGWEF